MPAENKSDYDPESLPDLLPIYYKRLFPYGPYYRWLNYGGVPKTYFSNREFSFTLKDDVYIRYQSFSDQSEMEKEIQKRCPYKIDIGAVFSHKPKDHKMVKSAAFQAMEKELVFDIDMTDYDDVRSCCSGADICRKCWPLMTIAITIIDRALRDDFGFSHLLWIYSGRRGVHCWVCDESARKLSQAGRSAIAEYLSIVKGGDNQTRKVILSYHSIHSSISESLKVIKTFFENYAVKGQDFLGNETKRDAVLSLIPDEEFRKKLEEDFVEVKATTSEDYWKILQKRVDEYRDLGDYMKSWRCCEEIMLTYTYPRLDVNVSKGVNHLLKSPFSVHPKTGRVCIPIDLTDLHEFDPFAVPTISQICDELDKKIEVADGKKLKEYKYTSLKKPIDLFNKFVKELESKNKSKLLEESDMQMEF